MNVVTAVRRAWPQFSKSNYGLQNIADFCEINYQPHDALEDVRTAGEIFVRATHSLGISISEWSAFTKSIRSTHNIGAKHAHPGNPDGPYFGETIVFTGELSMPRSQAASMASESGCEGADSVNKQTTILVIAGNKDDKIIMASETSTNNNTVTIDNTINGGSGIDTISYEKYTQTD